MKRIYLLVFMLLLLSGIASAALIGGRVYDYSLGLVEDATVEIDTEPKQREIAKQGVYAFNVPAGEYIISAVQSENGIVKASTHEKITVKQDGEYKLDLILFPSLDEDKELADAELSIEPVFEEEPIKMSGIIIAIISLIAVILAAIVYFSARWRNKIKMQKRADDAAHNAIPEENHDTDLLKVIDFIRKQGSRTTQKEIRKNFPSSEAKISLILTDLEAQGKIRKIKKGRGNVVVMR